MLLFILGLFCGIALAMFGAPRLYNKLVEETKRLADLYRMGPAYNIGNTPEQNNNPFTYNHNPFETKTEEKIVEVPVEKIVFKEPDETQAEKVIANRIELLEKEVETLYAQKDEIEGELYEINDKTEEAKELLTEALAMKDEARANLAQSIEELSDMIESVSSEIKSQCNSTMEDIKERL